MTTKAQSDQDNALVEFITFELGITFDTRPSNVNLLAEHLGVNRQQVHATLSGLTRRGILSWDRHRRAWTVVKAAQKAPQKVA